MLGKSEFGISTGDLIIDANLPKIYSMRVIRLLSVFLILLFFLSAVPLYAQNGPRGFKVGISNSTINCDRFESGRKNGFAGGLVIIHEFNENIILQPEVLFVMKGAKFYGWYSDPGRIDAAVSASYLEVPVLAGYRIRSGRGLIAKPYIGPAFAFRFTAKVTYNDTGDSFDLDQYARSVDAGMAFGLEFGYEINGRLYSVDARATPGLVNQNSLSSLDIKNHVYMLLMGILF